MYSSLSLTLGQFAVKEFKLREGSARGHKRELENLAILNHLKHPNIAELLGSYTYDGRHNLLFPLADTGNLAQLLETERHLTMFSTDEALVVALAALTSAVEHVHEFAERKIDLDLIGCHHDLRPRNILVSGSSLILADFGLTTFKPTSQNSATPFKSGMDDYVAPDDPIHRSSDIWSLGCIVAEVATYMELGRDGVQQFRQAREHKSGIISLHQFHRLGRPSGAVDDWLSKRSESSSTSCALLVPLVRDMLCLDQSKRPKAKEITWRLRLVALHGVAGTVNDLFRQVRKGEDTLDMFIEHTAFDAWRHAMGIRALEGESARPPDHDTMSQFDAILGCLGRLCEYLKSRLSRGERAQQLDLSQLFKLNEELRCFLDQAQTESSRTYFNISVMRGDEKPSEQCKFQETGATLNHEIRMRANIKSIHDLLARDAVSGSRKMMLEPESVELSGRVDSHYLGQLKDGQRSRPVWVEWREYRQHGADKVTMENLYERAAGIAELLSQEKPRAFRTLQCTGFFHDPVRAAFGLVFELPGWVGPESPPKPVTLHQKIRDTSPDLDDRFKLASLLATSILELHTVGWFHKGLTAFNVMFFTQTDRAESDSIREPFLVGFGHSRPNEPIALTSGVEDSDSRYYQHPTYLKERFGYRPEFDYYSLGIILMEIGFWTPFAKIRKKLTGSYEERRQKLLTDYIPRLRQHMGREYCEAVRRCIQCDFGGSEFDESREKDLLIQFGEQVVARLRGCSL